MRSLPLETRPENDVGLAGADRFDEFAELQGVVLQVSVLNGDHSRAIWPRTRISMACWREPESRKRVRRAEATTFPTVLNSKNRNRFGRALWSCPGKVNRLMAVNRL